MSQEILLQMSDIFLNLKIFFFLSTLPSNTLTKLSPEESLPRNHQAVLFDLLRLILHELSKLELDQCAGQLGEVNIKTFIRAQSQLVEELVLEFEISGVEKELTQVLPLLFCFLSRLFLFGELREQPRS